MLVYSSLIVRFLFFVLEEGEGLCGFGCGYLFWREEKGNSGGRRKDLHFV